MSLVIPPGFGSAAFVLTGPAGTEPYITTIGVSLSGAGGDFVAVANNCHEAYATNFLVGTNNDLALDRVVLAVGQDGAGGSVESTKPAVQGSAGAEMAPTAMSVIIRKLTGNLGRKGRGRMFLPGTVSEAAVDASGRLAGGTVTGWQGRATAFLQDLEAGVPGGSGQAAAAVLLHSSSLVPTPITAMSVSPIVGWIRGRIR